MTTAASPGDRPIALNEWAITSAATDHRSIWSRPDSSSISLTSVKNAPKGGSELEEVQRDGQRDDAGRSNGEQEL